MRLATAAALLLALPGVASARTLHVRAGGTLAAAEAASRPGDRIVVHAAPAVYDGGIRLKPRQRLIGRRGPRIAGAVVLARRTTVRGLRIVRAERSGIYGRNVGRVAIRGNDVSGHNTSCGTGFLIPAFNVPTTVAGVGVPIDGLPNGWAGIMVDATRGARKVVIRGNRVHDSECGDGIDVRAFKTADVTATIAGNTISSLREGADVKSVLAIGLQTSDTARMTARVDRNRQSALGNDEDIAGPDGADSEGVFVNPTGASSLTATVTRNTYTHVLGRGGFSANGLEFVSMGDGGHGDLTVRDSSFSGTSGDVLEQLALGTDGDLRMTLDNVVATGSTGFGGSGEGNTVVIPGNNADCLVAASGGAGDSVETTIRDSTLTNCANNGLTFGASVANGSGPTKSLTLAMSGSRLTGNRGNNLRVGNLSDLDHLSVDVRDTDLADAHGTGSVTPADASFENLGTARDAHITVTGSCLDGGSLGAAAVGFDADLRGNYWNGSPRATGTAQTTPFLTEAPARCG